MSTSAPYSTLITTTEVSQFENSLHELRATLYEGRDSFEEKVNRSFTGVDRTVFMNRIHQADIDISDRQAVERILSAIETEVSSLPTLTVAFALELPYKSLKAISAWLEDTFQQKVILDIQIDSKLLGGMVVYLDGRYHDYSLRNTLHQLSHKGELRLSQLFDRREEKQLNEVVSDSVSMNAASKNSEDIIASQPNDVVLPEILKKKQKEAV